MLASMGLLPHVDPISRLLRGKTSNLTPAASCHATSRVQQGLATQCVQKGRAGLPAGGTTRFPGSWRCEPAYSSYSSPGVMTKASANGSGSMTALMGADGKASSLRKLVVDGVDDSANVQVKFCLKYRTTYGQAVKVIGSHTKLGYWDVNKALVLTWTEGDRWVATVELPAGSVYEYKYVLVDHDGRNALAWQGGGNSVLALGDQDEQGVEVQDNWGNSPGGAAVIANGQTLTREDKLQAWANEMKQYRAVARTAKHELTRKAEELAASKAQIARLKMELSMGLKAREDLELRLAELESENLSLRAQVAQSQIAMKSTLEEAIRLLQQEIEEGEEATELEPNEDEEAQQDDAEAAASSSSSSSGWGWGRGVSSNSNAEADDMAYSGAFTGGSNNNGNKSAGTLERFGIRLNGGPAFGEQASTPGGSGGKHWEKSVSPRERNPRFGLDIGGSPARYSAPARDYSGWRRSTSTSGFF